jgi:hypothetical protein
LVRIDTAHARLLGSGWHLARKAAGYGAAATLSLYMLVKVIWVAVALLSHKSRDHEMSTAAFVTLNTVTIGMAVIGVTLGLGLASDWGRRVPSWLLVLVSWVSAGFLVPMIPFMLGSVAVSAAAGGSSIGAQSGDGGGSSIPGWETVFLTIGFLGMAVGLAIALPIYMRERWPHAFAGRVGDLPPHPLRQATVAIPSPRAAMTASVAAGLVWLNWAAGGTTGLAHTSVLDTNGRLLNASWGLAALTAAACVHMVVTRRWGRRMPLWFPMTLAYATTGSLFAWSSWRLLLDIFHAPAEHRLVAFTMHPVCIAAGMALLASQLRVHRERLPTPGST